jgi:hypothetical protein
MQGSQEEGSVADEFGASVRLRDSARPDPEDQERKDLTGRVAREFEEMRGLSLSTAQATRLFSIEWSECVRILDTLVDRGVLRRTDKGEYETSSSGSDE